MDTIEIRMKYLRGRIDNLRNGESEMGAYNAEGYDWAIDDVVKIIDELIEKDKRTKSL